MSITVENRQSTEPTGTRTFSVFEWMLAMRYLRARRKEGFISVIAGFSFIGIMLGVATLIIVMAVMNGFRAQLFDKILGFAVQPRFPHQARLCPRHGFFQLCANGCNEGFCGDAMDVLFGVLNEPLQRFVHDNAAQKGIGDAHQGVKRPQA